MHGLQESAASRLLRSFIESMRATCICNTKLAQNNIDQRVHMSAALMRFRTALKYLTLGGSRGSIRRPRLTSKTRRPSNSQVSLLLTSVAYRWPRRFRREKRLDLEPESISQALLVSLAHATTELSFVFRSLLRQAQVSAYRE
jgi:hypothetical protein